MIDFLVSPLGLFLLSTALLLALLRPQPSISQKTARAAAQSQSRAKKYARDTIILFQFARNEEAPSGSPFCCKAETLLRLTGVKYENAFGLNSEMPKGKVPAYIYNGTLYEDSQLGYSQLVGSQLLPNLDAGLDASQKAISTAFRRLIENHLIPIMSLERWRDSWPSSRDHLFLTSVPMPFRVVLGWFIQRGVLKSLYGMGTARFTDPELYEILVPEDLEAIATQLGDKQWILGSRTPSTTDAALFGFLATAVYWAEFSPRVTSEILKHPNLISFFQRLRERCWPEWQDPVVLADYNVAPSGSGTPRRSPRRRNVGAG